MELDDLRQQWQQPEPAAPVVLTAAQLGNLLAQRQGGLVAQMRRNAHWDTGSAVALSLFALTLVLFNFSNSLAPLLVGMLLLLLPVVLYFYYRMLGILRQLDETAGNVRSHLVGLCAGLRQLMRAYYYTTLAVGPLMLLTIYGFLVGKELARAASFRVSLLLSLGAVLLVFGALLQVAVMHAGRGWVHRLYGQHLDRLEANLRELDELGGPGA